MVVRNVIRQKHILFWGDSMKCNAFFDQKRLYRYLLTREWDSSLPKLLYIMLNPSTADESTEDQTSKQCIYFAKELGFGSFDIVNLYSLISTNPKGLRSSTIDPIGKETDTYIIKSAKKADKIIVAWGEKHFFNKRNEKVTQMLKNYGYNLYCLKMAKSGHPRHPSRLTHEVNELVRYL